MISNNIANISAKLNESERLQFFSKSKVQLHSYAI